MRTRFLALTAAAVLACWGFSAGAAEPKPVCKGQLGTFGSGEPRMFSMEILGGGTQVKVSVWVTGPNGTKVNLHTKESPLPANAGGMTLIPFEGPNGNSVMPTELVRSQSGPAIASVSLAGTKATC